MKVLHVFKTFWPDTFGGIERTIDGIARATAPHGVESEVFALSRQPDLDAGIFNGYRTTKAGQDIQIASTGFSLSAFGLFREAAERNDIVHYHYPWPFMDVLRFATGVKRPSVVTYHSDIVRQKYFNLLYGPMRERFLKSADAIVTTSPNYLKSSKVLRRHTQKATVIPIGLDPFAYPDPDCDEARKTELPCAAPYFFFVGVNRYYKGVDVLVEAARISGLNVVIAGGATSTMLPNVHCIGPISEAAKMRLIAGAAAFVLPSNRRSEAFGIALLEAAMLGRPLISCEIGTGTSFINLDRQTGLVVPPNDPAALTAAMREIVDYPSQAEEWGRAGKARFEKVFTGESMGRSYAELYTSVKHAA